MLLPVILFILGLILLIKGGDWFIDGAIGISKRLHVPDLLIGATVVSVGTTLPEVLVSSEAALSGQPQTAYGNAIGSIICNTALIAAIAFAAAPCAIDRKSLKLPTIFFFVAAAIYVFTAYGTGHFTRFTGLVLLTVFAIYMIFSVRAAFRQDAIAVLPPAQPPADEKPITLPRSILLLAVGAVVIAIGANLLVTNGTKIADALGMPESVIALTFVALGTSLPELITMITSLRKKHGALSVGNIIGANFFNLVLVSGLAVTLSPFDVPAEKQLFGMNASLVLDIPLMLIVMLIFTVPSLIRKKTSRVQGVILLALYAGFCVLQFGM